METIPASDIKKGMPLMLDGAVHVIEDFYLTGTAKTKRKIHVRLRNLMKGLHVERVFSEDERVAVAELQQRRVQFSYREADTFVFLDSETFEELRLGAGQIGDRHWFLKENEEYKALFLEGKLLEVVLPDTVALRVEQTAAPQRGGSDAAWKPARLEGGLQIMVPLFIAPGELVRVETATRRYVRKESED